MKNNNQQAISDQSYYYVLEEPTVLNHQNSFILLNSQLGIIDGVKLKLDESLIFDDPFFIHYHYEKSYNKFKHRLYLTSYRIIIQYQDIPPKYRSIPYGYIQNLEQAQNSLVLKNGMRLTINGLGTLMGLCRAIIQQVNSLPVCIKCKDHKQHYQIYDSLAQVQRMRIRWKKYWVVQNKKGKICINYPLYFIIPKKVDQSLLTMCVKHRNMGGVPVLSFHHEASEACIWRTTRLKIGNSEAQMYSQAYLQFINPNYIVFDLRDKNQPKDHQTKNISDFIFENLSGLKEAYQQVICSYNVEELAESTSKIKKFTEQLGLKETLSNDNKFFKHLGRWYEDIDRLLCCAFKISDLLQKGQDVIVQQLHGYDRAAQIISLASVIMDPFYRTFKGLSVLMEKQFVGYGHPFSVRLGFRRDRIEESSPVVIQFFQSLQQLIACEPEYFQYSGAYLARLSYQLYTTNYYNFIHSQPTKTICGKSIWSEMPMFKSYYNYQWCEQKSIKCRRLHHYPSIKQYLIWKEHYDMIGLMEGEQQRPYEDNKCFFNLLKLKMQNKK